MSNSRDDRYYSTLGKSRRSPPVGDSQGGGFFQTGQGGRTVLPPISSAFPTSRFPVPVSYSSNQYSQPRSSPGRYDYNPAVYNQWPANGVPTQSSAYSYSSYDAHDNRYPAQPNYQTYPSRTSPTLPDTTVDSRKLPPLSTSQAYGRDDRWSTASYTTVPSHAHGVSQVRSPTASYPATYNAPYPSTNPTGYGYGAPMTDPRSHTSMHSISPQSHSSLVGAVPDPRASSPYGRGSSHVPPSSYTPPPISPTSGDEPTIKKKRKRADAAQLKILTETYARTAFPSTEERLELAKLLDMTPRSVQIWFQNRRQSMRQTRQSSASTGTHQSFAMTSQPDSMMEDMPAAGSYEMAIPTTSYMHDTHGSQTLTSSHRRARSQEAVVDSRKWPRGY